MRRSIRAVAALALIAAALPLGGPVARAQGTTYHVSPSGDDTAPGTQAQPWRTLHRGMRYLRPGDTLIVHGGDYYGSAGFRQPGIPLATASSPIQVLAAPGERPVLHGVINIQRPSYWLFDGINITRDPSAKKTSYLLRITNGVGWTYRNGEIWGNSGISNVLINGTIDGEPRDWRFANNCVHHIGAGPNDNNDHNMYVTPGYDSGPGIIERNLFFNAPNGNHIKAAGPNASTGAANLKIRYNTMFRASQGVLVSYGSHHVSLQRNLIVQRLYGRPDNPGIRGHELRNRTNIAANNLAYAYRSVLLNTQAQNGRVRDGGGNRRFNPEFASTGTCSDFEPLEVAAQAFGHLAT